MNPKVSILTPVRAKTETDVQWLHECIYSILHQSEQNLEMIIVDDHSPANLEAVKERWVASSITHRLVWLDAEHQGVSAARNQAAAAAKAPLLLPVDGDDKLGRTAVERMLVAWDKRGDSLICPLRRHELICGRSCFGLSLRCDTSDAIHDI